MKVLAAMSGGVDSAVAAARAAEAGHDVTGVHLALSANPQSFRTGARGCCTIEDSRDARRAADVIGIPFYVWDLADRFREDVVDDFVAEYEAGRTPNPCLRCNEKIKFAALLTRRSPWASTRSAPATTPGSSARTTARAAPRLRHGKDQSYVLGVLNQPAGALAVPARRHAHDRGPRGGRAPRPGGRQEARQPRHLLHRRRRHPGLPRRPLGAPARRHRRRGRREGRAPRGRVRLHHRPAQGPAHRHPAADGKPRYVLDISPVTNTVTVGPVEALAYARSPASARLGGRPRTPWRGQVQVRPTAAAEAGRDRGVDDELEVTLTTRRRGGPGTGAGALRRHPGGRQRDHRGDRLVSRPSRRGRLGRRLLARLRPGRGAQDHLRRVP